MVYEEGGAPVLSINGLWAGYGSTIALEDITLQVSQGGIMGIIGPNGSGKSTLFKVVLGLLRPWRGEVMVFGRPSRTQRPLVGYMPQMEMWTGTSR